MIKLFRLIFFIILLLTINIIAFRNVIFKPGIVGLGWDWSVYADPHEFIQRAWQPLYVWYSYGLGMFASASLTSQFIYRLITFPLYPLAGYDLNKAIIILFPLIAGCSTFYVARKDFKLSYLATILASVLYMLSPITYSRMVAGHQCWYFSIAIFPLFISGLLNINNSDIKKSFRASIFTGIVLSVVLTGGAQMWMNCAITYIVFIIVGIRKSKNKAKLLKAYAIATIVAILISSGWLYTLFADMHAKKYNLRELSPIELVQKRTHILNALSPSFFEVLTMEIDSGVGKEYVYPSPVGFMMTLGVLFIMFVAFFAFIRSLKNNYKVSQISFLGVTGLFLVMGVNTMPGLFFYKILGESSALGFAAMANPFRWLPLFWFPLSLLAPIGLQMIAGKMQSNNYTSQVWLVGIVAVLLTCSPFLIGNIANKNDFNVLRPFSLQNTKVGKTDRKFLNFLRTDSTYYRCSIIPNVHTMMPSNTPYILPWRLFYRPEFPDSNYGSTNRSAVKSMMDTFAGDSFAQKCGVTSTKYVLLYNNIFDIYNYSINNFLRSIYNNTDNIGEKISYNIKHQEGLTKVLDIDGGKIYKNQYFIPPVYSPKNITIYNDTNLRLKTFQPNKKGAYISTQTINFKSIGKKYLVNRAKMLTMNFVRKNPTRFEIQINHNSNGVFLVLNESFNPNWSARIIKNGNECLKSKLFGNSFLFDKFNLPLHLSCINSIKLTSHFQVNGFANAWFVPPHDEKTYIIIEFIPQLYYEIFLIIGMVTLIGCLSLLFFYRKPVIWSKRFALGNLVGNSFNQTTEI